MPGPQCRSTAQLLEMARCKLPCTRLWSRHTHTSVHLTEASGGGGEEGQDCLEGVRRALPGIESVE